MVTVTIGGDSRSYQDADASWVTHEVNGRRRDGQSVCVGVRIHENGADMVLSTPGCRNGFGGGRAPNSREQRIFLLWERHHLNTSGFTVGELVAFLKELSRVL